jgi:hypothetical protein
MTSRRHTPMLLFAGLLAVAAGALPFVLLRSRGSSEASPPAAAPAVTRARVAVPPGAGPRSSRAPGARKPPGTTALVHPVTTAVVAVATPTLAPPATPAVRRTPSVHRVARPKPAAPPVPAPRPAPSPAVAQSPPVAPLPRAAHEQRARGHAYGRHGRGAKHEAVRVRHGRPQHPQHPQHPVVPRFAAAGGAPLVSAATPARRTPPVHRVARPKPAKRRLVPAPPPAPSPALAQSPRVAPPAPAMHLLHARGHAHGDHGRGAKHEAVPVRAHGRPQRYRYPVVPRGHGGGSQPGKGTRP